MWKSEQDLLFFKIFAKNLQYNCIFSRKFEHFRNNCNKSMFTAETALMGIVD